MKGMKEIIISFFHGLLYLSEDFADSLNQSQLHKGISSLISEDILSLYEFACELASNQEEFRLIDLKRSSVIFKSLGLSFKL